MCKLDELRDKREDIYRIARAHKVETLYVFGSCARKEETPDSDVDFIADFLPGATVFNHIDLEHDISELLNISVDVVSGRTLRDDSFGRQVRKEIVAL